MKVEDLNYENLYKIGVFCLRFTGAYPDIPRDKKWIFKFTIMQGVFTITAFFILYSTIVYEIKDATKACANMSILVMYAVVTMKYLVLLWHQDQLMDLINLMNKDYEISKSLTDEEKQPVLDYAKKAVYVTTAWFWLSIFANLVFLSKPFMIMFYNYLQEGEFRLVEFYDLVYPDPIERIKFKTLPYCTSFGFLYFFDLYTSSTYAGVVPMGPTFMLHACGQLEMAKVRIMHLFDDETLSFEDRRFKLREIAKQLQDVYSFVMKIQNCFMLLYELTLKGTSFILPIVLYKTIESFNHNELALEFPTMFIYAIALSSCPCYYGDLLIEQGESFRNTVYMSGWEGIWDKRVRVSLLIIQTRTQRPLAIQSMFRNISLDALTDVFHQAYAIFNVILAAWDIS